MVCLIFCNQDAGREPGSFTPFFCDSIRFHTYPSYESGRNPPKSFVYFRHQLVRFCVASQEFFEQSQQQKNGPVLLKIESPREADTTSHIIVGHSGYKCRRKSVKGGVKARSLAKFIATPRVEGRDDQAVGLSKPPSKSDCVQRPRRGYRPSSHLCPRRDQPSVQFQCRHAPVSL